MWKRATGGLSLLGAGDDGNVTVAAFRRAGDTGSVLLAVTHDGQMVRQIETEKALGVPAVVSGLAFVPWAGQYVSVIDLANGDEMARVTLRQETSRAWTEGGTLWFGGTGYIRFDERIRDASRGRAATVSVPPRELPGMPKLIPTGTAPLPAEANAEDKTREYAKPVATESGASLQDGHWYGTYFRLAMGFDAGHSKLAWVNLHDADFIGGAAANGGLYLCDDRGQLTQLDASSGAVLATSPRGAPLHACIVNIDAEKASGTLTDVKPLATQLEEAVRADDPQLVVVQKLLLRELTTVADESATKALVDSASDPRTSPDLLGADRTALANADWQQGVVHGGRPRPALRLPEGRPAHTAGRTHRAGPRRDEGEACRSAPRGPPARSGRHGRRREAELRGARRGSRQQDPFPARVLRNVPGDGGHDDDMAATQVVDVGQALVASGDKAARAQVEAAAIDASTVPYARDRLGAILSATPAPAAPEAPKPEAPKKAK